MTARVFTFFAALAIFVLLAASGRGRQSTAGNSSPASASLREGERRPVLVELFTSEGCSSCPPADALLIRLQENQPVAGAEIILLGFHVDYWDHIGWRDRFSSAEYSERQRRYAGAFDADTVYTPQMVVDGRIELNGADARRATAAITQASQNIKARMELTLAAASPKRVSLSTLIRDLPAAGDDRTELWLAITESNLYSQASSGENSGRRLDHTAVVRHLRRLASLAPAPEYSHQFDIKIDSRWKRTDLAAVVFVQQRSSRRILGAAQLRLAAPL